jgi:hypothetical protein
MRRVLLMLSLLAGLAACSSQKGNTQIVVVVWSDLMIPTEMDSIHIDVTDPNFSRTGSFPVTTGSDLPVVLSLVPPDNQGLAFTVTASGFLESATTPVVSQTANLSFLAGDSRKLTLFLGRACPGGVCAELTVDPRTLPVYNPKTTFSYPDAGAGASLDSGADGAADGGGADGGRVDAVADGVQTSDSALDKSVDVPVSAPDSGVGGGGGGTGTGGTGGSGGAGGTMASTGGTGAGAGAGGSGGSGGVASGGATAATGGTTISGGTMVVGGSTASGGIVVSGGSTAQGGSGASGGSKASGGTSAQGGTTSSSGTKSSGGTTGTSTAPSCTPGVSPTTPLISDFSTTGTAGWHPILGGGKWGTYGVLSGSIFSYAGAAGSTMSATVDTTNQDLVLYGSVAAGDYAGGGMSFDECVNTSTYTGVQFTLGGTVAGCDFYFDVQTYEEKPAGPGQVGGCTSSCYVFPGVRLTSTTGAVTLHFSDLKGGLPAPAAIASEIVGLQWQFQSPAPVGDGGPVGCTGINLTITNVSFVSN